MRIIIPVPDLQASFAEKLGNLRRLFLPEALATTVERLIVPDIDRDLGAYVAPADLAALAKHGIRGEILFAVPVVLASNPRLLGYYRLLLGYSQKAFYTGPLGTIPFRSMEDKGSISEVAQENLGELCQQLCNSGSYLLAHLPKQAIDFHLFRDLALMTLGAQLRGAANVTIGSQGVALVFGIIKQLVEPAILDSSPNRIALKNAAGRKVYIEFAADPDIIIKEEMPSRGFRNVIAIEIKAGTDFSNIHNRLGEAEKSHINAKRMGFSECWTILNVALPPETAKRESPSTNRFYLLSDLKSGSGQECADFRSRIISLTGIADLPRTRRKAKKR